LEQIKRWHQVFPKEQMMIIKSEDFFQDPSIFYQKVLNFLDLPSWDLKIYKNANPREYSSPISENTKDYLNDYFKSYNEALYDYLGVDFQWG
jgi:hypothetical protein